MEHHYTRQGAAEKLGVSVKLIDAARRQGKLHAARDGNTPLFSESELERWAAWRTHKRAGILQGPNGKKLYTRRAAATFLGISRQALYDREQRGTLKPDVISATSACAWYYEETLRAMKREGK